MSSRLPRLAALRLTIVVLLTVAAAAAPTKRTATEREDWAKVRSQMAAHAKHRVEALKRYDPRSKQTVDDVMALRDEFDKILNEVVTRVDQYGTADWTTLMAAVAEEYCQVMMLATRLLMDLDGHSRPLVQRAAELQAYQSRVCVAMDKLASDVAEERDQAGQ